MSFIHMENSWDHSKLAKQINSTIAKHELLGNLHIQV